MCQLAFLRRQYKSHCITRHAKPIYQRTGWDNQLFIDVTMTSFLFEVTDSIRPGWNCKHANFLLKDQVGFRGNFNLSLESRDLYSRQKSGKTRPAKAGKKTTILGRRSNDLNSGFFLYFAFLLIRAAYIAVLV